MPPYLDADMLFVASKLQPGTAVDETRPLRMRFEAPTPMVPLQLTVVAAEPHLTEPFNLGKVPHVEHPVPVVCREVGARQRGSAHPIDRRLDRKPDAGLSTGLDSSTIPAKVSA